MVFSNLKSFKTLGVKSEFLGGLIKNFKIKFLVRVEFQEN